ncbi:hypothetical protein NGM99_15210 [Mesorhizobium sp. RP14(2022)]|uniref:Uncharacterized protein n=1 Tax=Mesorhizobium liriopis TaxID=2953882 RepID=A0ABT1C8G4_9HYPH|nr:hypothetical protein [Mesorhizobium liriopis]MCO6051132.1 hypothetical protein [Mesorhizobium liriopis]
MFALRSSAKALATMEELFGDPAYRRFTLQDRKRLPARFFARVVGARTSRLR